MGAFDDLIPGEQAATAGGANKAPTVEERKAGAFLIRALGAEGSYNAQKLGPRSPLGQWMAENTPTFLNILPASIGNSPRRQVADSAQDEFIAASLRQDSGAAIPEPELERQRRIYYPIPGDGPEATRAKAQARQRALLGLYQSAGRMAPETMANFRRYVANMRKGSAPKASPQGGPQVGQVVKGYRFKGGNPADPNSWSKM